MITLNREPTPDERDGIDWWNALPEIERAEWLDRAGSARPADAWAEYKRARDGLIRATHTAP